MIKPSKYRGLEDIVVIEIYRPNGRKAWISKSAKVTYSLNCAAVFSTENQARLYLTDLDFDFKTEFKKLTIKAYIL